MDGNGIGPAAIGPRPGGGRRVIVTGAGGFIGRHVVAALAASGHRVTAVSRQAPPSAPPVIWAATPMPPWSDAARDGWAAIVAGADAVVHLAAMAHLPIDSPAARRALWRMNVRATERVGRAAVSAGLADVVFVSSIKAAGERSEPGRPLTESSPPQGLDCYGAAKRMAERRLERLARSAPATRFTVLRPPLVYGPGVGANMAALSRLAASGWPLPLASIDNRRSLLYVGNLADAIVTVLGRPEAPGGIYHLCDGEAVSTPGLVRAIARAADRPARLWPAPPALLTALATAAGRGAQWSRLGGWLESSDAKFRAVYGWQPPFTLADGLARQVGAARGRRPA